MTAIEEHTSAKQDGPTAPATSPDTTVSSPAAASAGETTSAVPKAADPSSATHATSEANPFDEEHTPSLPPRPDAAHDYGMDSVATPASGNATHGANAPEETVSPQVEALRSMFPDFDVAVLYVTSRSMHCLLPHVYVHAVPGNPCSTRSTMTRIVRLTFSLG